MSARQAGVYALLAALVIASGWYVFSHEIDLQRPSVSEGGADMFVNDMDLSVLDETGRLAYRVRADRMMHYPGDERFTLVAPDITIHQSGGDVWHIVSEHGETNDDADRVWLLGDVDIRRIESPSGEPVHIITRDLLVLPEDEIAETEAATTIRTEQLEMQGVGARADFANDTLELRSDVRGRYDDTRS